MYVCEMQICYNIDNYFVGIQFHFYHISWMFCFFVRQVWRWEINEGIQRVLIQTFKVSKPYLFRVWWNWDTLKKQKWHK